MSINKAIVILTRYWIIFILFIPLCFFINKIYNFNIINFISNFFVINITYVNEWWFLKLYIQLLLLFPFIKKILDNKSIYKSLMITIGIYVIAFILFLIPKIDSKLSYLMTNIVYKDLFILCMDQFIFCIGCICSKYCIFEGLQEKLNEKNLNSKKVNYLICISIFIFRTIMFIFFEFIVKIGSPDWIDFIYIPLFIFSASNIINSSNDIVKKIFYITGRHSNNIWLIHPFLYRLYIKDIIYSSKSPILIFIIVMVTSISISIFIEKIYIKTLNKTNKLMDFINKKIILESGEQI